VNKFPALLAHPAGRELLRQLSDGLGEAASDVRGDVRNWLNGYLGRRHVSPPIRAEGPLRRPILSPGVLAAKEP
jgi:hypothetical protein